MTPLLQVADLHHSYRRTRTGVVTALRGVSLIVHRGEAVGLIGDSGCGKSTLLRCLARLEDPQAGDIHYETHNIGTIPARRFARHPLRREIQVVLQDPAGSLNPLFRVERLIADPCRVLFSPQTAAGQTAAGMQAHVRNIAEQVGLSPDLLERYPHQLSGGQQARVGIARALAVGPALLALDEPTASLDAAVQARILKLLHHLKTAFGLSLFLVSHDLNVVRLLCDRVLVMQNGRIVEDAPTRHLFSAPRHPHTRALIRSMPGPAAFT